MLETTVDNLQTPVDPPADPPADSLADSAADLLADCYLVRLGVLGQVGRLRSAEPVDYGEVLASCVELDVAWSLGRC